MNATLERIIHDVEQLPLEEQCELAAFLNEKLETTFEDSDPEVAAAWDAELASRAQQVMDGSVELIPAEQVFRDLAEIRAKRQIARSAST